MSQLPNATLPLNLHVGGTLTAKQMGIPAGTVTDAAITAGANLSASKLQHRYQAVYAQEASDDAIAEERIIHVAAGAGTIVSFAAALLVPPDTAAGSSGRTATIDLKKNGTTVLTGAIQLDNDNTARVLEAGILSSDTLASGDVLSVAVTTAGSTGTHPIGVYAIAVIHEAVI